MVNPEIDSDGTTIWRNANGKYHRDDGPAIEHVSGTKSWYQHGIRHQENGPAVVWASGTKHWYQHGLKHRTDGPAVIYARGTKQWWLNDQYMSFDVWLDKVDISDEDKVMMKLKYG
jgi:hypothetical protein